MEPEANDSVQPVVTKKFLWERLVVMLGLILGIGGTLVATQIPQDLRSKAKIPAQSPYLIVTQTSPVPVENLEAPYIRLVNKQKMYGLRETVPVDVYLHTNGQKAVDAKLLLSFDPDVLTIDETGVENKDIFKTFEINLVDKGKLQLELFVTTEAGQAPVVAAKEVKIATLNFKTKALEKAGSEITLLFEKDKTTQTSLVPFVELRPLNPDNILATVSGTMISVGQ